MLELWKSLEISLYGGYRWASAFSSWLAGLIKGLRTAGFQTHSGEIGSGNSTD